MGVKSLHAFPTMAVGALQKSHTTFCVVVITPLMYSLVESFGSSINGGSTAANAALRSLLHLSSMAALAHLDSRHSLATP